MGADYGKNKIKDEDMLKAAYSRYCRQNDLYSIETKVRPVAPRENLT